MFGDKIEDYEILEHLGKGGFAHVYRARCRKTGTYVAIKMIDKALMASAGMIGRVRQEVTIHSRLKHPAILELYTFFEDVHYVYLVLELAHNGELAKHFKLGTRGLSEKAAADIFRQVLSGVLYLHTHNIIHRDLSLSNLLLTKDLNVKIADFGLATQLNGPDEKHVTMCGTPNYISPEVASRELHGLPADVWGLGCMLYTLLVGSPPFHTQHVKTTLNKVINADFKIPVGLSHQAEDLLLKLLCKDPSKRITLKAILEHPFLNYSRPNLKGDMSRDSGILTTVHSTQHSSKSRSSDHKTPPYSIECFSTKNNDNCNQSGNSYNMFKCASNNENAKIFPHTNNDLQVNLLEQAANNKSYMFSCQPERISRTASICENLNNMDIRLQRTGSACSTDNKENTPKVCNVNSNTIGVPPLCTERLPLITHRTRNAVLKVDDTGVTVEFIKKKTKDREEKVTEICHISKDGMKILLYTNELQLKMFQKNSEPIPDEVFTYHNLPQKHWKKYLYASRFVDLVKAKTPKITLYSSLAKCQLMENGTDIEMFFYNGEKITYTSSDGLKVIDSNLKTHHNVDNMLELKYLVDHFEECSNRMKRTQSALSCIPDECFPLIIGKRPALQQQSAMSPSSQAISYNTPLLNLGSFRTAASTQARSDYTR